MIPFGNWTPDQPVIYGPHLRVARNVTPKLQSYGPFKDLTSGTEALAGQPYGAGSFRDQDGATHVFAGSATKLYELANDGSWTDVTRASGGDYATGSTSTWRFAQFGDYCVASNWNDDIQVFTMSSGSNFAALGGSPPRARHVTTFRDFLVIGYTPTSSFELRWSGFNDITEWTAGTNQSDTQVLPDGGIIQGFAGSDVLYIFQQARIRRMQYVGPPLIMQIDPITEDLGCVEPNSIADFGSGAAFLSNDGFYIIMNDQLQPIGAELVDQWFQSNFNTSYSSRMSAAADTKSKVIYWSFPSNSSVNGRPDTILMYNWVAKKWAYAELDHEGITRVYSLGYTLDGLDTLTTNIDNFDVPFDDPSLTGDALAINAWGTTFQLGPFSGSALEAQIDTGDFEHHPQKRTYVSAVEPYVDGGTPTIAVASREKLSGTVSFGSAQSIESTGKASVDASGRFHRYRVAVPAASTWNDASAIDFEMALDGEA